MSEWKLCTAFCVLLYKVKSAKCDSDLAAVELWCRGWRPRQPDIEAVRLEFVTNEKSGQFLAKRCADNVEFVEQTQAGRRISVKQKLRCSPTWFVKTSTMCGYRRCEIKTALHNVYRAVLFFNFFIP